MKVVIITQLLIFTLYILYVVLSYGVQKSISESWYISKHKFLFTLMCWGVGVLQCMHANESVYFFFSGAFLTFVGTATSFRDGKITEVVHSVGAIGAIAFSLLGLLVLGIPWVLFLNIIAAGYFLLFKGRNNIFWLEIVAFYSIFGALIQYYLTKTI